MESLLKMVTEMEISGSMHKTHFAKTDGYMHCNLNQQMQKR